MENLSLFNQNNDSEIMMGGLFERGNLDVIKMDFIEAETMSWKDLFSGFDELHAITYSWGINFVYQLLGMFKKAEIIFGCDEVISYSLQEVMAYQCKLIERMRESAGKMKLDLINLPRVRTHSLKVFSESDKRKIKAYCMNSENTKDIGIALCLYTGMRIGEICALKWEDIDLNKRIIYVRHTLQRIYIDKKNTKIIIDAPKSEKSIRNIPMSNMIYTKLKSMRENFSKDDFFLTGDSKSFMEPRGYQYTFKKMLKECKIAERNFHCLRHTFATDCISVGMDVKSLSEILGHSDVSITLNRYVHSSDKIKKRYLEKLA